MNDIQKACLAIFIAMMVGLASCSSDRSEGTAPEYVYSGNQAGSWRSMNYTKTCIDGITYLWAEATVLLHVNAEGKPVLCK